MATATVTVTTTSDRDSNIFEEVIRRWGRGGSASGGARWRGSGEPVAVTSIASGSDFLPLAVSLRLFTLIHGV